MRRTLCVIGMFALAVSPAWGHGGVFTIGSDIGFVHHLGGVAAGHPVRIDITSKQSGLNLTCPIKVTFIFVRDNNSAQVRKVTRRKNALQSRIVVNSTFGAEALLVIQTQNINHSCGVQVTDVDMGALGPAVISPDGPESSWADDPPQQAMPVDPALARQSGLP